MIYVQLQGTRTGSSYFYKCLDSHPDIDANPEMFRIDPEKKAYHMLNPGHDGKVTTFKLMYNHIKHFKLWDNLMTLPIMHIMRDRPYKKVLSDIVSNIKNDRVEKRYIEPMDFLRHVKGYKENIEVFRRLRKYTEYKEFRMEDFVQSDSTMAERVGREVCTFLRVDYHPMKSDSKKLTPEKKHWDYFENAEEILKVLGNYGEL